MGFVKMKVFNVSMFLLLAHGALADFKKDAIKWHKTFRQRHGVKKLKWNKDIAKFAQDWCNELAATDSFKHRTENNPYGENLFRSWGQSPGQAGKIAIKSWYSEEKDYDYGSPGFSMATGHNSLRLCGRAQLI